MALAAIPSDWRRGRNRRFNRSKKPFPNSRILSNKSRKISRSKRKSKWPKDTPKVTVKKLTLAEARSRLRLLKQLEEKIEKGEGAFNPYSNEWERQTLKTLRGKYKWLVNYLKGTYFARLLGYKPEEVRSTQRVNPTTQLNPMNIAGATQTNAIEIKEKIDPRVSKAAKNTFKKTQSIEKARDAALVAQEIVNIENSFKNNVNNNSNSNSNFNGGSKRKKKTRRKKRTKKQKK
jgi:hypothetical protein